MKSKTPRVSSFLGLLAAVSQNPESRDAILSRQRAAGRVSTDGSRSLTPGFVSMNSIVVAAGFRFAV